MTSLSREATGPGAHAEALAGAAAGTVTEGKAGDRAQAWEGRARGSGAGSFFQLLTFSPQ